MLLILIRFVTELNGRRDVSELSTAHIEGRIEPYPDDSMKITWSKDGQPLMVGSRFKTLYDFGFAALDVLQLVPEDAGTYTCTAKNNYGQAQSSFQINVRRMLFFSTCPSIYTLTTFYISHVAPTYNQL